MAKKKTGDAADETDVVDQAEEQPASEPAANVGESRTLVGHVYDVEIPHCHLGRQRIVVPLEKMEEGSQAALAMYMKQSGMTATQNPASVSFVGAAYKDGSILEK